MSNLKDELQKAYGDAEIPAWVLEDLPDEVYEEKMTASPEGSNDPDGWEPVYDSPDQTIDNLPPPPKWVEEDFDDPGSAYEQQTSTTENAGDIELQTRILEGLNPEQSRATQATEGPVLINAGAGSGKTRVLTRRAALIVARGLAQPHQVMLTTFTNRAAAEMRSRIGELLGRSAGDMWIGTMHGLCIRILRTEFAAAGLRDEGFTIASPDDRKRTLKLIIKELGIDTKEAEAQQKSVEEALERWQNLGLSPDQARQESLENTSTARNDLMIYEEYRVRLREGNLVDINEPIQMVVELFRKNPTIAKRWRTRFRYIMVDEAQDTNPVQDEWVRFLASEHQNVCYVGDEDQSIYSFRWAEPRNLVEFPDRWPGTKIFKVETNYRSTKYIVEAASRLVAHNKLRLGKTIRSTIEGAGPDAHFFPTEEKEASYVADQVARSLARGQPAHEIAILVRGKMVLPSLEQALSRSKVHYHLVGETRFYEREEIRDCLAMLRLISNPSDNIAFRRVANKPARGIGDVKIREIENEAFRRKLPILDAAANFAEKAEGRNRKAAEGVEIFLNALDRARRNAGKALGEAFRQLMTDTGYLAWRQHEKDEKSADRVENIQMMAGILDQAISLEDFLERAGMLEETSGKVDPDAVTLITFHKAKGLEFEECFVTGCDEGVLPHSRSLADGPDGIEEERRLAYVAFTRAKRRLVITGAEQRNVFSKDGPTDGRRTEITPSRFLDEAGITPIDHRSKYGGGGTSHWMR